MNPLGIKCHAHYCCNWIYDEHADDPREERAHPRTARPHMSASSIEKLRYTPDIFNTPNPQLPERSLLYAIFVKIDLLIPVLSPREPPTDIYIYPSSRGHTQSVARAVEVFMTRVIDTCQYEL